MTVNRLFRRNLCGLFCLLILFSMLAMPVQADTGPKPSITVSFDHMGSEVCYGTLLSKDSTYGPWVAWEDDGGGNANPHELEPEIWQAFTGYVDPDGFYFLQRAWKLGEGASISWTYYPPRIFKILLYYPETDTFAVSGICDRYAFDTYYTVDMKGVDPVSGSASLAPVRTYQWQWETLSLIARIVLTVIVELGIAFLFGFRGKKVYWFLTVVNVVTQVLLNVLLNAINYHSGQLAFLFWYVVLEIGVLVLEALLYSLLMPRFTDAPKPVWLRLLYALAANVASFFAGLGIAMLVPGIF